MSNIKTTDVTAKSVGAVKAKKNNSNTPPVEITPKDQLKNIKTRRKELNSELKALTKQENQLKKTKKTSNKKK